jgi:hypothetical protein
MFTYLIEDNLQSKAVLEKRENQGFVVSQQKGKP